MRSVFQSPSLRGSGRFRRAPPPLHVQRRFNPLHCGAVVASGKPLGSFPRGARVSIPFIAGQWSLPRALGLAEGEGYQFQSPSLRGSGRFQRRKKWRLLLSSRFNPLHCGAVVASKNGRGRKRPPELVSIPFIAGQWSLRFPKSNLTPRRLVSIPFIAGQWSLQDTGYTRERSSHSRFNPLHCGAVVASICTVPVFVMRHLGFNPLHCGAVVASWWELEQAGLIPVSIPFIAGQWSLQA